MGPLFNSIYLKNTKMPLSLLLPLKKRGTAKEEQVLLRPLVVQDVWDEVPFTSTTPKK